MGLAGAMVLTNDPKQTKKKKTLRIVSGGLSLINDSWQLRAGPGTESSPQETAEPPAIRQRPAGRGWMDGKTRDGWREGQPGALADADEKPWAASSESLGERKVTAAPPLHFRAN